MKRRHYLATAGGIAATLLGGCLGDGDDAGEDQPADTDTPPADQNGTNPNGGDTPADDDSAEVSSPTELIEAVVTAAAEEDVERYQKLLHPANPLSDAEGDVQLGIDGPTELTVETSIETADPTVEDIYANISGAEGVFANREDRLRDALEGEAATVNLTIPEVDQPALSGGLWVAATDDDGNWRLLWQGYPIETTELDVRVLADVEFEKAEAVARLTTIDDPSPVDLVVDSGRTERTFSDVHSRDEPMVVPVAEDGGELTVTAVGDGGETLVHRERYGDRRVIAAISVEKDETTRAAAIAQVDFTDRLEGESVEMATTRLSGATAASGSSADEESAESSIAGINSLRTPVESGYDEITVSLTQDGEQTEVHRERLYYGDLE